MYTPLEFLEQVKTYFRIPSRDGKLEADINQKSLDWAKEVIMDDDFIRVFTETSSTTDRKTLRVLNKYWKSLSDSFHEYISNGAGGTYSPEEMDDFRKYLIHAFIYHDWRYCKLAYKLSPYMVHQFLSMEFPKSVEISKMIKVPARTFYLDLNGCGDVICKGLEGVFIITGSSEKHSSQEYLALIRGTHGRLMPMFSQASMSYTNEDSNLPIQVDSLVANHEMEDGTVREFNFGNLYAIIHNFLLYLYASNKDVEMSTITKKYKDKVIDKTKEPKNQFKEVKEYEVGFRISSTIGKKYKYISGKTGRGKGSSKSPHFRVAHWHHYWTGSGENKKLVLKWVEGVFVNGGNDENGVAVVHNVK